jgi:hypothetical protein
VLEFDSLVEAQRSLFLQILPARLEWDIFLSQVNTYKSELLNSPHLNAKEKQNTLTEKMPKYLWRAIGLLDDSPMIELVFDATDIEQGNVFVRSVGYNEDLHNFLSILSKKPAVTCVANKSKPIFNWYSSQPTP